MKNFKVEIKSEDDAIGKIRKDEDIKGYVISKETSIIALALFWFGYALDNIFAIFESADAGILTKIGMGLITLYIVLEMVISIVNLIKINSKKEK